MKKIAITLTTLLTFVAVMLIGSTALASDSILLNDVVFNTTSYTYSGSAITPNFTVTDQNGNTVSADNYNVSFNNNVNAGTASIQVTGKNGYAGSVTKSFTIGQCAISSGSVTGLKVCLDKTTDLVVKFNGKSLVEGVDYNYTVSNYSKAGQTVTYNINGIGNFKGTKTVSRTVYPSKINGIASTDRTNSSFKLTWNSIPGTKTVNYKVYKCDENGDNRKLVADVTSNNANVSGYKAGEYAYLVVRAYVTVDDTNYYGDYSNVYKTVTKPATVSNYSIAKTTAKNKLKFTWGKVGCTGYQIQYSTYKDFSKNLNTVTVSGSSTTSKSVTIPVNESKYYSRVRAFRQYKYNNKTYTSYSAWSNSLTSSYSKVYASYTTSHVYNPNRTTNLKLACKAINGTIVYPNEVFSFNKVVGQRTAAKGYKPATIFTGSSSTSQSIGGGICQVASTLFNTALNANFGIVQRSQHSQRVSYCPLGRDAAIFWGSEDFKFKNTSKYPIKIEMKCENGYVYCKFKVSYDVSPKKVSLKVTRSGNKFTLKRYVDGKCNYTTNSVY